MESIPYHNCFGLSQLCYVMFLETLKIQMALFLYHYNVIELDLETSSK